jgi:DNA-binding transcriptional ArsR family regulator
VPDVDVLDDPAAAVVALEPTRSRLLAALARAPSSAAGLAAATGLPRQRLGHHLRALEGSGLLVEVERRRHGGLTERVLAASASSYLVSPAALGAAAADPGRMRDRLSAAYAVAVAARAVRELGGLLRGATAAGRRLPTLTVDTDIRFRSAADRAEFADELAAAVRSLAARYHDESAPGGRWYRLVALSHPRPRSEEEHP